MIFSSSNINYDLKYNNRKCLEAIKILDKYLNYQKKYLDHNSILKIFYQEISAYITNLILIQNSSEKYNDKIKFPYLNSNFLKKPKKVSFLKKKKNFSKENLNLNYRKKKIFISNNFHLKKKLLINLIGVKKIKFIDKVEIKIPDYEIQLKILEAVLTKIMFFLELENTHYVSNFLRYVKNLIENNHKRKFEPKNSILLVGSNMKIENRILSSKFLQNKTNKVISFNHSSYPFYIYNEPIRNVEYSFCTDYVSYGRFNIKKNIQNKIFSLPKFHYISCPDFENLKINKKINKLNLDKFQKYLYIPNMLNGNIRYGPYRDMEDKIYLKFQTELMDFFKNTDIKIHPKGKDDYSEKFRKSKNLNFDKIYKEYDVYIFDYFSSPFSRAIATNKPIIYFDIGLRNLEKNVLDIIKKRVYYFKINLNQNFENQFNNFLINFLEEKDQKINLFSKKFSLNKKNKNFKNILKKLLY